jgi:hypothetical protein
MLQILEKMNRRKRSQVGLKFSITKILHSWMELLEVRLLLGSVKLNISTLIHRGLGHIQEDTAILALSISSRVTALHRTINLTRKCMQISIVGPLARIKTSYITKSCQYKITLAIVLLVTLKRIMMEEKCSLKVRVSTKLSILVPMRQ